MLTLNSIVDRVVVLNLHENPDRLLSSRFQFEKHGILYEVQTSVKLPFLGPLAAHSGLLNKGQEAGEVGCAIAHYTAVKTALLDGCGSLAVFEDDALLCDGFAEAFDDAMREAPEDWQMLLLYSFGDGAKQMPRVNDWWGRARKCWSSVAVLMRREWMEAYIREQDEMLRIADAVSICLQTELPAYCLHPSRFLVIPRPDAVSDIRPASNLGPSLEALDLSRFGIHRPLHDDTLVIIPYAPGYAQGWELDTAVRGWHKYFAGRARIVLVGQRSKTVDKLVAEGLAELLERPARNNIIPREMEFAAIARLVIRTYGREYPGFVKTDDDIYPVNPFTLADVQVPKFTDFMMEGNPVSGNTFQSSLWRSRLALEARGLPTIRYTSHAPRWYDMARLATVLDEFGCERESHNIEPLYFNRWAGELGRAVNVAEPDNGYKYTAGQGFDGKALRAAIAGGVKWVNHSEGNYSRKLIDTIREVALGGEGAV